MFGLRTPAWAWTPWVCAALLGCATPAPVPPPPSARTTVVLLPDEDGSVGVVTISNGAGSLSLDQPFSAVAADRADAAPTLTRPWSPSVLESTHALLLQTQPSPPVTFVLHFVLDKPVLTDESQALLPALLEAVRKRKPTEISVFGHADATGPEEYNFKLSADRAQAVARWLRQQEPSLDAIEVRAFGDKAPLFGKGTRGAEPRNRRAEVMIL